MALLTDRIVIDPDKRFGKPHIQGTQITVGDILGYLSTGMTVEDLLVDFAKLSRKDNLACLAFAAVYC